MLQTLPYTQRDPWAASAAKKHSWAVTLPLRTMPAARSRAVDRHQNKRPFQPQITSFFSSSSERSSLPSESKWQSDKSCFGEQDASIQASLLSVGMRIRKAVPEGYKTHKSQLFTDMTSRTSPPSQVLPITPKPMELTPFCGIHKVGGLGVQESLVHQVNGYNLGAIPAADALATVGSSEEFFLSQESNASVTAPDSVEGLPVGAVQEIKPRGKRRLDFVDDDDEVSLLLPDFVAAPIIEGRNIAKPRSRRKPAQPVTPTALIIDADFGEAPFLIPCDMDIEMGEI
jgi:Ribonucleotide reductase inhibitor